MVERPTLTNTASVRVVIPTDPVQGRSRGIKFTCVHPSVSGRYGQTGEASGLVPEVLHESSADLKLDRRTCLRAGFSF